CIVGKAVQPAFAGFSGRNHRMMARARVLARVAVGRRVAAERGAAGLAGAEMDPPAARLDALLALVLPGAPDVADRADMCARVRHAQGYHDACTGSLMNSTSRIGSAPSRR